MAVWKDKKEMEQRETQGRKGMGWGGGYQAQSRAHSGCASSSLPAVWTKQGSPELTHSSEVGTKVPFAEVLWA